MENHKERLVQLNRSLTAGHNICSSEGFLTDFPPILKTSFETNGVGLIVCLQGHFSFSLNQKDFQAQAGETLFIPENSTFRALQSTNDLKIFILIYKTDTLRNIMGNLVVSMYLYMKFVPEPCYVWNTGEEAEVIRYMHLLNSTLHTENDSFNLYEQKLLLLALTHRLCSIYNRKLVAKLDSIGHKNEIFMRLIQLIEQHYTQKRSMDFYADKLCLSPKYLSALSKSICGYTVQELVFKSIICKSISLLKNTQKNIQEISNDLHFPNASYFGTFFRKQTGLSPQQFRKSMTF